MASTIEGILNIDKPAGLTSHDVVQKVRRIGDIRRVGHTGTLDPLATGLLIICVGRATRLAEYLVDQPKTYLATIRLGQATSTYDAEGPVLNETAVTVSEEEVANALNQFRGPISQVPPMFSAVKQNGQRLYKYARAGLELERPARQVTIYELRLLLWEKPNLHVLLVCSAGTYVRSIAHDLGQVLGCGGHITALRRTAVGDFNVENAIPLAELSQDNWLDYLQPDDAAVGHLPRLLLTADEAMRLYHGQTVPRQAGQPDASVVRAYDSEGRFVGIVTSEQAHWQARKIFYRPEN